MIETGDWAIPDLIEYLVSVRHTLQPTEIERLQLAPAFPEETTAGSPKNVPKLKASDLYEPLDVFRDLGLPIIDWRSKDGTHKWRIGSEAGTTGTV